MKKYSRQEQKLLAIWAADCAERVLPFFKKAYPKDKRPIKAIKKCREWAQTGIFKMADIRKASLDSHAAARKAKKNNAACFAARAAGQAVATAHVPRHAFGAAYYALKLFAEISPKRAVRELDWQTMHMPKKLRKGWRDWQSKCLPKNLMRTFL
ncbi:MAG: hypothetical protein PHO02_04875 [Candidatus Nanoarchaeia archaeon]|nr:hypothetical protein [Candidatus Nanoarchaeia archaeon]